MKQDAIEIGGRYTDNKQGVREVLEIGAHIRTFGADAQALGVRYRVLVAAKQPDVGTENEIELKSFAAWAKAKLTADELEAFTIRQAASRIHARLTPGQRAFLATFCSDCTLGTEVECRRDELRVAKACFNKGLLAEEPVLSKEQMHFYAHLTALGLAVLALVLAHEGEA